jgi:DNA-binding MarR family transcriptional regulator
MNALNPQRDAAPAADTSRLLGLEVLEHAVPYKLYKLALRGSRAKSAYIKKRVGLAERSTLDKVRVSRTTDRLVRQGLVTGHRNPDDRRKVELKLTRAGKAKYRGVVDSLATWDSAFVQVLDPKSLTSLIKLLQTLDQRIDELERRY